MRRSSLYRNPPEGGLDQPEFVNAVAAIETRIGPRALLDRLLEIERVQGRVRDYPNAPRTLDLDIVLYGDGVIHEPGLTIPHPRMMRARVRAGAARRDRAGCGGAGQRARRRSSPGTWMLPA